MSVQILMVVVLKSVQIPLEAIHAHAHLVTYWLLIIKHALVRTSGIYNNTELSVSLGQKSTNARWITEIALRFALTPLGVICVPA